VREASFDANCPRPAFGILAPVDPRNRVAHPWELSTAQQIAAHICTRHDYDGHTIGDNEGHGGNAPCSRPTHMAPGSVRSLRSILSGHNSASSTSLASGLALG
jgi:hypothetical protein